MSENNTCAIDINGHKTVACRTGLTLFAGLRTQKVFLPTGCGARGVCGQCRVKVVEGETSPPTDNEKGRLKEAELSAGWRLGCQLRLQGDLEIEASSCILHAKEYKTTVASIIPLTYDIRRFSFAPAPGDKVPHRAGQFINFVAKPYGEAKGMTIRCFSFATPASVEDRIDIIVRRTPNGAATTYLFDHLKEGDEATLIGPFGEFRLSDAKAPCIWIAGGSGLSPFVGMLREMLDRGVSDRPVKLFFGAVNERDLYYVGELREFSAKHPWFKYIPALSGGERCEACADYGLITDVVARHISNADQYEAYLCGSPGMIEACIATLGGKGVKRENIYFDRFG
ncbi:MAG: 2Fe-2S iron-sulfur cluster binding domain-containing protein [Planctomycetota bacterium]|jgi:Na+-transporting NADH:ubiquinone oxidoreductase subunit F|nr:2Fe-2S iron-sulfur cluster binding domain-containing protein [Planctomycetota bacterium]